MKVIAQTANLGYVSGKKWLVEVSNEELTHIAGQEYGSIDVKIGMEVSVSAVFQVANKARREQKAISHTANNLRAIADLLESIEPTIQKAIFMPEAEVSDGH